MDAPIYDIDQAVGRVIPRIRLRGVVYELADLHPGEEERALLELADAERELTEAAEPIFSGKVTEDGTEREITRDEKRELVDRMIAASRKVAAQSVKRVLKDIPDEVAGDLSVFEYKAIMTALGKIRNLEIDPTQNGDTEKKRG